MEETEYETVIGLEVHVQLATKSKIFCSSSAAYGGEPNEYIDPVTLGLPGALPVLNRLVVDFAIMTGLSMGCQIRNFNRFARKHYFYPDLPKGYQISQFDEPICEYGSLLVRFDEAPGSTEGSPARSIGVRRIHMEEDAGKNIHDIRTDTSLVDLNRAGVPLLEIVSEPDMRSAAEAAQYLRTVRQLVRYLGVSDGNMEEGSLRCDANVSLRKRGAPEYGTRAEIKNLNSFKFVERAIEYEVARQAQVLNAGQKVIQETRLFDSVNGTTRSMRSKEESSDYRYMPDPDLPPLMIEESWISKIRGEMPTLPEGWRKILCETLGLSTYDAQVLIGERENVEFFDAVLKVSGNPKAACNWVTTELFGALNKLNLSLKDTPVSAKSLGELIKLIDSDAISGKAAKTVFEEMLATSKDPEIIVKEKGLQQVSDAGSVEPIVNSVIEKFTGQFAEYVAGNDKLHGFFVGQVLKAGGSANPKLVNELIKTAVQKARG